MTLHGRHESLRFLAEAASAAMVGQGALVMVRADPGLGVTSLLEAHLSAMRDSGLRGYRVPVLPPEGRTPLSAGTPEWEEPALVVIDDLHRADDETLLALHDLAEGIYGRPLLIVTGRHRGVAPDRFAGLDRLGIVHDLHPLDEDAVLAMRPDVARAGEAGGNPWLLSRITAGDRATQVSAWAAGLAGADVDLLRCAALLGESASVDELAAVSGTTPSDALTAVARLSARGLVQERSGEVQVRHPVVRTDIATTSAGLRGSVARALAERDAPVARIADHLAHAPMDAWAVRWVAEHAEQLTARSSPKVVRLLESAVAALSPGDPRVPALRAARTEALLWSGSAEQARRAAAEILLAQPDPPVRHRLLAVLGIIANGEFAPGTALSVLEPERRNGKLPARLAALDAYAHLLTGDLEATARAVAEASEAADEPLVEVYLCNIRAIGQCLARDYSAALEQLDRASVLLEVSAYEPAQWLMSRLLRAVVQNLEEDPAVMDTIDQARPVARSIGLGFLPWLHTIAAVAALKFGEWDRALAEVDAGLALPHQHGMAGPLHAVAATILVNRGDLPAGREHAELADQAVPHGVATFYQPLMTVTRALLAGVDGDLGRAVKIVRDVVEGGGGMPTDRSIAPVCVPLVRIAVAGGERDLARRLTERMLEWSHDDSTITYCRSLIADDVDELLAAAQAFADSSAPLAAAQAAQDAAVALAAAGRSDAAKAAYSAAIDKFAAMAAHREIDRTAAHLRAHGVQLGASGPRRRPKHGWDSLTGAEMRVVELVAQGLTNREVAERLVVSVRTVDSHVSRVLRKLGCSSRLELAVKHRERR
ncbi:LuxR C-terminal-related transcriptional regulator [Saccharopolyspora sp. TS4A08]|uniref:LuxR C-terminal-related transcriptional regulator n=1 Tax=Saccharopolyspora ipomoeae TaxID=3042027 RepID=A0ABT6PT61_9PSEU|nr:LuxR family transcriptional regulator [Saccharopolyspora sp. TS4A08]MDI2031035.1 LuxR C-terminal-related transcriptional regulator [Saccharopolyspora sp. TS4A08]